MIIGNQMCPNLIRQSHKKSQRNQKVANIILRIAKLKKKKRRPKQTRNRNDRESYCRTSLGHPLCQVNVHVIQRLFKIFMYNWLTLSWTRKGLENLFEIGRVRDRERIIGYSCKCMPQFFKSAIRQEESMCEFVIS